MSSQRPSIGQNDRMSLATPRTVLLVEDHALTRGLLKESLEGAGFHVFAFESARQAIKEFDRIDPDALVVDIDLGDRPDGVDLAVLLRAQAPYLGVVFLTNYPSVDKVEGGFEPPPGSGFLNKGALEDSAALVAAIDASLDDEAKPVTLNAQQVQELGELSAQQMSVLRLIAEGCSNSEIAERRGITVRSAERLVSRTFTALGIADDVRINPRVAATRMYVRAFGVPEAPRTRT
jgi:DNA-binding NarL/FixJ family response regulator